MTVGSSLEAPAAPAQQFDVLTVLDRLQARVRSAEDKAAGLERALTSNRRIGMAVGVLMERHKLTPDLAFDRLHEASSLGNIKLRDLAEDVLYTGESPLGSSRKPAARP